MSSALRILTAVIAVSMCVFATDSAEGFRLSAFEARVAAGDELEARAKLHSGFNSVERGGIRVCKRITPRFVEREIALDFRRAWPDGYLVRCTTDDVAEDITRRASSRATRQVDAVLRAIPARGVATAVDCPQRSVDPV
jgi:hypothetical protein